MSWGQNMDALVAGAIGALAAVFIGALAGLLLICRRQQKRQSCKLDDFRPEAYLISAEPLDLELSDVGLRPDLEEILADEQWVDDATGLIPHCLAVLRTCHSLTERLAALSMGPLGQKCSAAQIIEVARRVPPRVDDVVRSMYPPLDARLLEARAAALVLAVGQLALLAPPPNGPRGMTSRLQWIDQGLADMDRHLLVLREAALAQEVTSRIQSSQLN